MTTGLDHLTSSDLATLPPVERDLAHIAARDGYDDFLTDITLLVENGAACRLAFLLDGQVLTGRLVPPEQIATAVDALRAASFTGVEPPPWWTEERGAFDTYLTRMVAEHRTGVTALVGDLAEAVAPEDLDASTLPAALARRLITNNVRGHLTLADATLAPPGAAEPTTRIPLMRLCVRRVSAWWIVGADA